MAETNQNEHGSVLTGDNIEMVRRTGSCRSKKSIKKRSPFKDTTLFGLVSGSTNSLANENYVYNSTIAVVHDSPKPGCSKDRRYMSTFQPNVSTSQPVHDFNLGNRGHPDIGLERTLSVNQAVATASAMANALLFAKQQVLHESEVESFDNGNEFDKFLNE